MNRDRKTGVQTTTCPILVHGPSDYMAPEERGATDFLIRYLPVL